MKDSNCHPLKGWFLKEWKETKTLFRSIPAVVVALFVISVIAMNILANKTIYQIGDWFALDGGILVSWIAFLCMDIITKHFGPTASIKVSLFATFVNLFTSLIFYLVSIIPTTIDFTAFNTVVGGTWYILISSTIAFISSGILNSLLNYTTGKLFKKNPDGRVAFITRSYVSTFVAQFADNLIFSILTFMVFMPIYQHFAWTFVQCLTCSLLGAIAELVCEALFSPIGYRVSRKWKNENVGKEYIALINEGEKAL